MLAGLLYTYYGLEIFLFVLLVLFIVFMHYPVMALSLGFLILSAVAWTWLKNE